MTSAPRYDAIVLGLGGIGSGAAYWLAKRGARVLGLEQFSLGTSEYPRERWQRLHRSWLKRSTVRAADDERTRSDQRNGDRATDLCADRVQQRAGSRRINRDGIRGEIRHVQMTRRIQRDGVRDDPRREDFFGEDRSGRTTARGG
jgi:glycine/D-amino acid oxidase-like deaminating enzyme